MNLQGYSKIFYLKIVYGLFELIICLGVFSLLTISNVAYFQLTIPHVHLSIP